MEPSLFRMDVGTGAPPDFFAPEGQNWGFPTYCWEEMAKDGFRWWRRRLRQLSLCAPCSPPRVRNAHHSQHPLSCKLWACL